MRLAADWDPLSMPPAAVNAPTSPCCHCANARKPSSSRFKRRFSAAAAMEPSASASASGSGAPPERLGAGERTGSTLLSSSDDASTVLWSSTGACPLSRCRWLCGC